MSGRSVHKWASSVKLVGLKGDLISLQTMRILTFESYGYVAPYTAADASDLVPEPLCIGFVLRWRGGSF